VRDCPFALGEPLNARDSQLRSRHDWARDAHFGARSCPWRHRRQDVARKAHFFNGARSTPMVARRQGVGLAGSGNSPISAPHSGRAMGGRPDRQGSVMGLLQQCASIKIAILTMARACARPSASHPMVPANLPLVEGRSWRHFPSRLDCTLNGVAWRRQAS
jgi:hypothetical protein